jgi:hypothetical protein
VDDEARAAALVESGAADDLCYLAGLPHRRFIALAQRDWRRDVPLLRTLVESDAASRAHVEAHIWKKSAWELILSLFGRDIERDMYDGWPASPALNPGGPGTQGLVECQ